MALWGRYPTPKCLSVDSATAKRGRRAAAPANPYGRPSNPIVVLARLPLSSRV
jgi:hypothetical protein